MIILKELTKAKQINQQLRKNIQQMPPWQSPPAQPTVTKLTMMPKAVTTKTSTIGKKAVLFAPKTTSYSPIKRVTPVQKLTLTAAGINIQDDKDVAIVAEDD